MKRHTLHCWLCLVLSLMAVVIVGCAPENGPVATGTMEGEISEDEAKITATLAQLPAADRELAATQKMCPVGGRLGSMGVPIKVKVRDRDVFVCCKGCIHELETNPEQYLAKLPPVATDPALPPDPAPPSAPTTPDN